MHLGEVVQIAGALLVLIGFAGAQFQLLAPHSPLYLALNVVGALVLAVVATVESDWGFLLLEGTWAVVTGWSIVRLMRGQSPTAAQ